MSPWPGDLLTSPRADRITAVRRLARGSARRREGLFLAEGPACAREGLAAGAVKDLYLTEAAAARHPDLAQPDGGVRVFRCTDEVLAELADTVTPQGVVAVARLPRPTLEDLRSVTLVAICARVRDPGNAGTIIRVADAVGADAVLFTEASVDPYNPKCVRSTTGSLFHLPVLTGATLAEAVGAVRALGATVLAADGAGERSLEVLAAAGVDGVFGGPVAWVFGNEAWGLPAEDAALTDHRVAIPMPGRAESLNLAMAATICLYVSATAGGRLGSGEIPPAVRPD